MNFEKLFGPNLLSEFPHVSAFGNDVTSKLDADRHDAVGVYRVDALDADEVLRRLKEAGYEEGSEQADYCLMIVDEDTCKITTSLYFR